MYSISGGEYILYLQGSVLSNKGRVLSGQGSVFYIGRGVYLPKDLGLST